MKRAVVLSAVLCGLLTASTATAAAQPHAGKFWREGMQGMWRIGLQMPLEGAASIGMLGCRVTTSHATCRLTIHQHSYKECRVRMNLARHNETFPFRSWHCPQEWRPATYRHPQFDLLEQQKAL